MVNAPVLALSTTPPSLLVPRPLLEARNSRLEVVHSFAEVAYFVRDTEKGQIVKVVFVLRPIVAV